MIQATHSVFSANNLLEVQLMCCFHYYDTVARAECEDHFVIPYS